MIVSVLIPRLREGKDYSVDDFLARVGPQEKPRHDRIGEVIEPGGTRGFYLQVADDDLTDTPPAE